MRLANISLEEYLLIRFLRSENCSQSQSLKPNGIHAGEDVNANLPFILRPIEYIKLAQVERKLASHGIYFPTKYPLGFNRLAEWYILN